MVPVSAKMAQRWGEETADMADRTTVGAKSNGPRQGVREKRPTKNLGRNALLGSGKAEVRSRNGGDHLLDPKTDFTSHR